MKKRVLICATAILSFAIIFTGCNLNTFIKYTNPEHYYLCRSGNSARKEFKDKLGMDEGIFPAELKQSWNVQDFLMIYYNPFDPQYLGYISVDFFNTTDYTAEINRLNNYSSSDYIGVYGITGFSDYKLIAINADKEFGVIYALTDGISKIIYAELIFCNYFMDLDYSKYIPSEYLPEGFDASVNNPTRKAFDQGGLWSVQAEKRG